MITMIGGIYTYQNVSKQYRKQLNIQVRPLFTIHSYAPMYTLNTI